MNLRRSAAHHMALDSITPAQERLRRIALVFALVVAVLFGVKAIQTLYQQSSAPVSDFVSYFDGAQRLRAGLPLYRPDFDFRRDQVYQYIYPPTLAVFLLPFPTYQSAWWAWGAFSIACWLLALAALLRELGDQIRLRLGPVWWPVLLAALINYPPVVSHLFWGQTQLLLLLILTGSWWCLRRGRAGAGGALLGLAIALKMYPVVLVVPLLAQRQWRCVTWALATAVTVMGLGFVLIGWEQTWFYLTRVLPEVERTLGQSSSGNNSLAVALRNATGSAGMANALSLALRAAIVAAVAAGAWRVRNEPARALAVGMTMLVLVPPVIWEHYFVLIYLPWLDALACAGRRQTPILAVAYFLLASASLAYHVPASLLAVAQILPLAGAMTLLGCQLHSIFARQDT